jgi:hypothetical protein
MADPKSLDEALLMLQADPPVLTKSKDGQVGNQRTKYADLVQVNKQVLARLNELGLVWKCAPDLIPDGAHPLRFVLRYELMHVATGEFERGAFPLLGSTPQQHGSAMTYARRYALLAVTGIAAEDEDDDGDMASGRQTAQRATQQRAAARAGGREQGAGQTAQRAAQRQRGGRPALPGEDPDGPVGADQHRHMRALWADLGFAGDENRDNRLAITAKILGLPELDSSASLTRAQADTVIAALVERKEQTAAAVPDGGER